MRPERKGSGEGGKEPHKQEGGRGGARPSSESLQSDLPSLTRVYRSEPALGKGPLPLVPGIFLQTVFPYTGSH